MGNPNFITLGVVAERCGVELWQVRRLFERGLLPEPPRVGLYRVVPVSYLPKIRKALVQAGYLEAATTTA